MTNVSGKHTVAGARVAVTGAASGIGAATALLLQSQGWRVACLDRNLAGARATAGSNGVAIEVDVADEASVVRAFREAGGTWGGLDALVTAAGIINTTAFFDTTVAELGITSWRLSRPSTMVSVIPPAFASRCWPSWYVAE